MTTENANLVYIESLQHFRSLVQLARSSELPPWPGRGWVVMDVGFAEELLALLAAGDEMAGAALEWLGAKRVLGPTGADDDVPY